MLIISLGALLFVGGIVYMAGAAIWRGRLSDPSPTPSATANTTLEPTHRGMGFLGLGANWPGLALIAVGAILLLAGAIF
ncbi:MAG: hypothetical protein H0T56_02165 [Pseudaminobacter sp.]|nr:hypothetical protein [Pseudaminobacter sp.]